MKLLDLLQLKYDDFQKTINKCQKLLRHLPKGTLSIQKKYGREYYRKYSNGVQSSIKKDDREFEQLTARYAATQVMENAENNAELLDSVLQQYRETDPNILMKDFPPVYQNVPAEAIVAMGFPYTAAFNTYEDPEPIHEEHLRHTDQDGQRKRSKSELAIKGLYELLGIPAEYEKKLILPDNTIMHPAFTTWSEAKRCYMYHEHVGDLTKQSTIDRTIWKFTKFVENGLFPFDRVLFTYESPDGDINMELMKFLIKYVMC